MQYNDISNLKTQSVKRILTMTAYRNLIRFINDLIIDKAKRNSDGYSLSVDDLTDCELNQLSALFLEYDERDTSECFYEADKPAINDDITCSLLSLLQNCTTENKQDFAEKIRLNIIKKYKSKMQKMIDDQIDTEFTGYLIKKHEDEMYWSHYA